MQSTTDKGPNPPSTTEGGELTKEQLFIKCKNLLAIAQKAKTARDECQVENKNLRAEVEKTNGELKTITQQFNIAQEMLSALTDQKLKLAMEIDDLRKERLRTAGEVKSLYSIKEKAEADMESYKLKFDKVVKEKNELVLTIENKERSEINLQEDIRKLKDNHNSILHYCSEEKKEKDRLEKSLEETKLSLLDVEDQNKLFFKEFSEKYNTNVSNFKSILILLNDLLKQPGIVCAKKTNESSEELNESLTEMSYDQATSDREKIVKLQAELDSTKADHYKIVQTLEQVRIETKQLIDNSEQLDQEIETLKVEKHKVENELNSVINAQKDEIEIAVTKLKKIEGDNNNLKVNLHALIKENIKEYEVEISENKAQKEQLLSEFTLVQKRCEDYRTSLSNIKKDKESLIAHLDSLKNKCQNYDIHISNNNKEKEKLICDFNALKDNCKKYEIQFNHNETEKVELLKKYDALTEQCKCYENEISNYKSDKQSILDDLDGVKKINNVFEAEILKKKEEIEKLSEELNVLKEKCKENELVISQNQIEHETLIANLNLLSANKSESEFRTEQTKNEISNLLIEVNSLKDKCKNYEGQILQNQSDQNNLMGDISTLFEQKKEFEVEMVQSKKENDKLVTELNSMKVKNKDHESEINQYKNDQQSLRNDLTLQYEIKKELEVQLLMSKKEYDKLVSELNILKEKCLEYEKKVTETSLDDIKINKFEAELSTSKQKNNELVTELSFLKDKIKINETKALQNKSSDHSLCGEVNEHYSDVSKLNEKLISELIKLKSTNDKCVEYTSLISPNDDSEKEKLIILVLKLLKDKYYTNDEEYLTLTHKEEENGDSKFNFLIQEKDKQLKELSNNFYKTLLELEEQKLFQEELISSLLNCKCEIESAYTQLSMVEEHISIIKEELLKKEESESLLLIENHRLQHYLHEQEQILIEVNNKLKTEVGHSNNEILDKDKYIHKLEIEFSSLNNKCINLLEANEQFKNQISIMSTHFEQVSKDHYEVVSKKNVEQTKMQTELKECKELLNFKTLELEEINKIWAGRLNSLKVGLMGLRKSIKEMENQFSVLHQLFSGCIINLRTEIQESVEIVLKREAANTKHELLDEMHCMNQVLKERGEVISKLQESLSELQTNHNQELLKNEDLNKEYNKLMNQIKEDEDKLQSKEMQLKELENELVRAREMRDSNADVDVLSTSTISKTEDSIRLKDLEESFEDKYVKLKIVAVKLKKRLTDTTLQLDAEKLKFTSEKTELLEKIQHLSTAAKNVQKVQESFDHALDQLEEMKKEKSNLLAALKESTKSEETLKSQINTLEMSSQHLPAMRKQIDSLNATLKDRRNEMQKSEMEKKVEVMKYEELKKSSTQLENKILELTASLEQAVQQGRSNNVLELEMKNYEKLVADLNSQLNSERIKAVNLAEEKSSLVAMKSGLEEQIHLLEIQIKSEEGRSENLKAQLISSKEKNDSISANVENLVSQINNLKKDLNTTKNTCEQITIETSNITSDFTRKELETQGKIDALRSHVQSLEATLASTKQELNSAKSEIEHLRHEFDSYRLRAKTMLAKQKGDSVSQGEKEARELVERLKNEVDAIKEKLESTQSEAETLNNRLSTCQTEKTRCEKKYEDVTKVLHQKVTDYDTLMTEYKAYKLSSDTVLHNHKYENETKEDKLKKEIISLKETIIHLKFELNEKEIFENKTPQDSLNQQTVEEALMQEREDAEGSESVPSSNIRRLSNIVPLDVLLNNPIDDESRVPVLQDQINKMRNELGTYDVRTRHLSALLSEAEKDAARNSHQNLILKEEMRRLERSLERQPHIANTEYLKNVVFKFLTLQGGDEKSRLIPVLDTILKLSPDETHKLQSIAKGEGSWGSYLPSWAGL